MKLFNSIVFGGFVGFLVDYWLGRLGFKKEPARVIIAVITGVVVGVLVSVGNLSAF